MYVSLSENITQIYTHISALSLLLGTDYLCILFRNVYLGIRLFIEIYWGIFIGEKVLGDTLFGYPLLGLRREFSLGNCSVGIGLCV